MANVYISFLGTNPYIPCHYTYEEQPVKICRFVQEATIFRFAGDWDESGRIVIFTTEDAKRRNWQDNGHGDGEPGLESRIRLLDIRPHVVRQDIPDGKSTEELWEIFQAIYDHLQQGDRVVFDITHAFRSIPMMAAVVLNYAKAMKQIRLSGIYYGAMEALGPLPKVMKLPVADRKVPIFNLALFDELLDWSVAVDRFVGSGDAGPLSQLATSSVHPILRETRGKDDDAKAIRDMAAALEEFSKTIVTCRGKNISANVTRMKERAEKLDRTDVFHVRPFEPLFRRIQSEMDRFVGDEIADGLAAARWCRDHNLVQQGYTILLETLISYFIKRAGGDPNLLDHRELVGQSAHIHIDESSSEEWLETFGENQKLVEMLLRIFAEDHILFNVYRNLNNLRNDLNHAGYRLDARTWKSILYDLEKHIRQIEDQLCPALKA